MMAQALCAIAIGAIMVVSRKAVCENGRARLNGSSYCFSVFPSPNRILRRETALTLRSKTAATLQDASGLLAHKRPCATEMMPCSPEPPTPPAVFNSWRTAIAPVPPAPPPCAMKRNRCLTCYGTWACARNCPMATSLPPDHLPRHPFCNSRLAPCGWGRREGARIMQGNPYIRRGFMREGRPCALAA